MAINFSADTAGGYDQVIQSARNQQRLAEQQRDPAPREQLPAAENTTAIAATAFPTDYREMGKKIRELAAVMPDNGDNKGIKAYTRIQSQSARDELTGAFSLSLYA